MAENARREQVPASQTRRDLIKKSAVAGGLLVWTAPAIDSVLSPAAADSAACCTPTITLPALGTGSGGSSNCTTGGRYTITHNGGSPGVFTVSITPTYSCAGSCCGTNHTLSWEWFDANAPSGGSSSYSIKSSDTGTCAQDWAQACTNTIAANTATSALGSGSTTASTFTGQTTITPGACNFGYTLGIRFTLDCATDGLNTTMVEYWERVRSPITGCTTGTLAEAGIPC